MQVVCKEVTSLEERQACLAVRRQVFIEEQKVPPDQEIDGLDEVSRHFAVKIGDKLMATCRVRTVGNAAKIERVAVLKDFRRKGLGAMLMKYVLQTVPRAGNVQLLKLSSQTDAVPFYENLGFKRRGPEYLDAGIPHYDMVKELS